MSLVETLGPERHVHLRLAARPVLTDQVLDVVRDVDASIASEMSAHADENHTRAIASFDADAEVTPGETREVALAPERLRFFELSTGAAIPWHPSSSAAVKAQPTHA